MDDRKLMRRTQPSTETLDGSEHLPSETVILWLARTMA
jgi:hypothetical protein